jgi:hypothetical protein
MGSNFLNDDPFILLGITGLLGLFLFIGCIVLFKEYKKSDDKSRLLGSIVMLIFCAAVIAGGSIMIKRTFSNSKILKQVLESNETVRSLLEECKKRNSPDTADEIENQDAVLKRPYLIVGYENETKKLILIDSSEGTLTDKAFEEAGTIVLAYPYEIGRQLYQSYANGTKSKSYTETRYAVSIYFYDVENRVLAFFKTLTGDEFPEKAKSYDGQVSLSDIKDAVKTARFR